MQFECPVRLRVEQPGARKAQVQEQRHGGHRQREYAQVVHGLVDRRKQQQSHDGPGRQ